MTREEHSMEDSRESNIIETPWRNEVSHGGMISGCYAAGLAVSCSMILNEKAENHRFCD